MKYLIVIIVMLWSIPLFAWEHRLDDDGYHQTISYLKATKGAAKFSGVPQWFLIGLIYNESNGDSTAVGDGGRAFGLGQIHCGPGGFDWLVFLGPYGFKDCEELLDPTKNIIAISIIVRYLRSKMKQPDDLLLLATLYHKGESFRKRGKKKAKGYYKRVKWFGKQIMERHQQACLPITN